MTSNNEVSIIVPMYNASKHIESCLESLVTQDYKEICIILVDNNSNDGSDTIALEFLKKNSRKFLFLTEKKQGVSFARNLGINNATGRYICFVDSDDFLTPNSISLRVNHLIKTCTHFTYGSYFRFKDDISPKKIIPPHKLDLRKILVKNYVGNLTGMYDSFFVGKIYQKNIGHEDYQMWIEIIKKCGFGLAINSSPLGFYRITEDSLSANKIKAAIWHFNILKKHISNPFLLAFNLTRYASSNLWKIFIK